MLVAPCHQKVLLWQCRAVESVQKTRKNTGEPCSVMVYNCWNKFFYLNCFPFYYNCHNKTDDQDECFSTESTVFLISSSYHFLMWQKIFISNRFVIWFGKMYGQMKDNMLFYTVCVQINTVLQIAKRKYNIWWSRAWFWKTICLQLMY